MHVWEKWALCIHGTNSFRPLQLMLPKGKSQAERVGGGGGGEMKDGLLALCGCVKSVSLSKWTCEGMCEQRCANEHEREVDAESGMQEYERATVCI